MWVSGAKENLTNFNLTKSTATTLDDSPAQSLEYTYADKEIPDLESKGLSIFAMEDNVLYHIGFEPFDITSYYDNLPIVRKMIESFEILDKNGILQC